MAIHHISDNTIVVDLPFEEPHICRQLQALNETVTNKDVRDVVIDFFRVQILHSSSLSNLLILRGMLKQRGGKLILCHMATMTRYIFVVAGLDKVFDFTEEKDAALEKIQCKDQPPSVPDGEVVP